MNDIRPYMMPFGDVGWFCKFMGLDLYWYQRVVLAAACRKSIRRMRKVVSAMTDYERGYQRALEDINRPMCVVAEKWNPSECPRCEKSFSDYEPCDDGYYRRAKALDRCPFCGQKLDWDVVDY